LLSHTSRPPLTLPYTEVWDEKGVPRIVEKPELMEMELFPGLTGTLSAEEKWNERVQELEKQRIRRLETSDDTADLTQDDPREADAQRSLDAQKADVVARYRRLRDAVRAAREGRVPTPPSKQEAQQSA